MASKRFLFIVDKPPDLGLPGIEGIELLLMASAYSDQVSVLFTADGVLHFSLPNDISLTLRGMLTALPQYELAHIYVDREALFAHGVEASGLGFHPEAIATHDVGTLMAEQDAIFTL